MKILSLIATLAFLSCTQAQDMFTFNSKILQDENTTESTNHTVVALDLIRGFASGFLDDDITDIGVCGVKAIEIGHQFGKIFTDLFSGKFNAYLKAMNDVIVVFGMIPKEIKACSTFGDALKKVIARYHMTLNIKQFFQNMFFNLIFHLFDITSSLAYAVEGALDAGYFEAGK
jgi:hypothetical protein